MNKRIKEANKYSEEIKTVIEEHKQWTAKNFPDAGIFDAYLGIVEELGELSHAILKGRQGIRHTPDEILAMKKDACADLCFFIMHFWQLMDFSYEEKIKYPIMLYGIEFEEEYVPFLKWEPNIIIACNKQLNNLISEKYLEIFAYLDIYLRLHLKSDLMSEIINTWQEVKKRDWTKEGKTND